MSRPVWIGIGAAAIALLAILLVTWFGAQGPAPLRARIDWTDRGQPLQTVTVYYLAADSVGLVAEERQVVAGLTRGEFVGELVTQLTESGNRLTAPLPAGASLLHYFEDGEGEAVMNFNATMASFETSGILEERLRLNALTRTLAENVSGVRRVRLMVLGRPMERWGSHLTPGSTVEVEAW